MNSLVSRYLFWKPILLFRGQNIWPLLRLYGKTQYRPREIIEEMQFAAFKRIFEYAYASIPFYRLKYRAAGIVPNDIRTKNDIPKIPVLTKQEVMSYTENLNSSYRGRRFLRSTSGSTGKPLIFYKDSESMAHMDAIMYRNYSWYGIDLGDRQAKFWGHPLGRMAIAKTRFVDALLNRIRLSAFYLHEAGYKLYLRQMERFKPQFVYGYAQSIFQFSNYFYNRGIELSHLKIKAVILTGEMVFSHQIKVIKKVFGCPVTQEYGCTEVGLIGFGCPEGSMHVMENLMVETLQKPTEKTAEIVVSELYGQLFPFIRYRLGDRGRISSGSCSCGRSLDVLEQLSGRQDDFIICPDGRLIDPYLIEYVINEMPPGYGAIHQFRVIQEDQDRLHILLNIQGAGERIKAFARDRIRLLLPVQMHLEVDIVTELPKEVSGKLRCFISMVDTTRKESCNSPLLQS